MALKVVVIASHSFSSKNSLIVGILVLLLCVYPLPFSNRLLVSSKKLSFLSFIALTKLRLALAQKDCHPCPILLLDLGFTQRSDAL